MLRDFDRNKSATASRQSVDSRLSTRNNLWDIHTVDLSPIYKGILRAIRTTGRAIGGKDRGKSGRVRQVILFANGVLVFECSCLTMSIRLLIKIKETAYLVEPCA